MAAASQAHRDGHGSEVETMTLPRWPVGRIARRKETMSARGINYSDSFQDGDLANCENLSVRRWPYIATRNKREKLTDYDDVTALTAWNKLVAVCGTDLLFDGQVVGTVTAGDKQFAAVNTKLVIWPDKVYLDMNELDIKPLGAEANATKAVFGDDKKSVTFTGTGNLKEKFKVGDGVEIDGLSTLKTNNRALIIKTLTEDTITTEGEVFTPGTETASVTLTRKVPNLDYICESGNRLWGVSNEEKTIYSSALGDPTNFYAYAGLSTDSYALPVATAGDFTGCCKLSSSVLFWKEHVLHRIYGDYPAEYALHTTEMEGLRSGCAKSLTIINDALFYVGLHGVFTYAGGTPADISRIFGTKVLTDAVGGTDGEKYYLSVLADGEKGLYVFDPNVGVWLKEDAFRFTSIARIGKDVYLLKEDGTVWLGDSGVPDKNLDWYLEYTPFYEDVDGGQAVQGRKRVTRVMIRAELDAKAWMVAETKTGTERWTEAGKLTGPGEDMIPLAVPPSRGDVYRIRLRGHGPCTIKNVVREYIRGGDL